MRYPPQHGRIAGFGLPMRQVGMEQQVGPAGDGQAAPGQIPRDRRTCDWLRGGQDMRDLQGGVALGGWWCQRRTPRRRTGSDARHLGRLYDQRSALETRRLLDGADRAAALIAVEVDPVTGMGAAQRDDAGSHLARRIAPDVGQPPFVAGPATVRKETRHPCLGGLAQTMHDEIEIVAQGLVAERLDLVEVKQGSPALSRPA